MVCCRMVLNNISRPNLFRDVIMTLYIAVFIDIKAKVLEVLVRLFLCVLMRSYFLKGYANPTKLLEFVNPLLFAHLLVNAPIAIFLRSSYLRHINRAFLYSVGYGFGQTCCCKKSSTREWSDILFVVCLLCVEFFYRPPFRV